MVKNIPLPGKGLHPYGVAVLKKFILGMYHQRVRLRGDNENSLKPYIERMEEELPHIVSGEWTPLYSSSSNPAERAIQSMEGLVLTLRYDVQAH